MATPNRNVTGRNVLQFTMPQTDGRESREELRAILRAHLAIESTTALRQFLVHLLAALGAFVVADVLLSGAMSQAVRHVLLSTWTVCGVAAVVSVVVEWRLRTDEARLLARNHSAERAIAKDRR